ncbi:MAG: hypothetical protein ACI3YH_00460, partial [Eubacteriales bacterium]
MIRQSFGDSLSHIAATPIGLGVACAVLIVCYAATANITLPVFAVLLTVCLGMLPTSTRLPSLGGNNGDAPHPIQKPDSDESDSDCRYTTNLECRQPRKWV